MNEELDFDESEASEREEAVQVRSLPLLFAMFLIGMAAGALLVSIH